jgi:adenylate cyclase class IV
MARNIELKVRVADVDALVAQAVRCADGPPVTILQDDTFYAVPHGRLKLRRSAEGGAELIHYRRPDGPGARASEYLRVPCADSETLHAMLAEALGTVGRVRKRRLLLLAGPTRIHLNRVEGRGDFVELEVVLRPGQSDADGRAIALQILDALGLAGAEAVECAYVDLPAGRSDPGGVPAPGQNAGPVVRRTKALRRRGPTTRRGR